MLQQGFKDKIKIRLFSKLKISPSLLRYYEFLKHLYNQNNGTYIGNYYQITNNKSQIYLRKNSSDIDIYYQVFIEQEYSFLKNLCDYYLSSDEPLVLFDFGANIGLTSAYLYKYFPLKKLIALEPDESNFNMLKKNISELHLEQTTYLVNKAIWPRKANLEPTQFRDNREWSRSFYESKTESGIPTITVSQLLEEVSVDYIDILKIDIEGAEKEFLDDQQELSKILVKVKILTIEIHDEIVSRIDFTKFLTSRGFEIYAKSETIYAINKKYIR